MRSSITGQLRKEVVSFLALHILLPLYLANCPPAECNNRLLLLIGICALLRPCVLAPVIRLVDCAKQRNLLFLLHHLLLLLLLLFLHNDIDALLMRRHAPQALVQMSLHDTNPRVATAASWGLAAACHACRHRKSASTAVPGTSTAVAAQTRALAGLSEDGAMRSLVQMVLTGQSPCCVSSSFGRVVFLLLFPASLPAPFHPL